MTTRIVGGRVVSASGTLLASVPIEIELVLAEAFVVTGSLSLAGKLTVQTGADGRWSTPLECNDDLTPVGTLYQVTEKVPSQYGGAKVYLCQVLTGLPVAPAINEVLNLIVPAAVPVGGTYEPVGSGPQGVPGPAGPAGVSIVANRAALDSLTPDVEGVLVEQSDRDISWKWNGSQYVPVNIPVFTSVGQRDANYTERQRGDPYYFATDGVDEGLYFCTSDPSYRPPWNLPWGRIPGAEGYKQVTATQTPIVASVDLTGLSISPTLVTNRRMRVTLSIGNVASTVTTDRIDIQICDGANTVLRGSNWPVSQPHTIMLTHEFDSVAGVYTVKGRMNRAVGSGNASAAASATQVSFICIDDLGPSGAPS